MSLLLGIVRILACTSLLGVTWSVRVNHGNGTYQSQETLSRIPTPQTAGRGHILLAGLVLVQAEHRRDRPARTADHLGGSALG